MNESPAMQSELTPRRRRFSRGVFILPSIFTVGNLFCGYYAILATMNRSFDHAAQAIGIAIILDMLDGRIARMTNTATGFGLQLDSLADVISFGIAPSVLVLVWGLPLLDTRLAWIAAFAFTICGAMRLARFNIQAGHFKHFVGLPIPAGGGAIAAIVHFFVTPVETQALAGLMAAIVFALSFLMVSTIRYSSLKYLTLGKKSHLTILILALVFALIYTYSRWTLLILAVVYTLSGPLLRVIGLFRHKKSSEGLALADTVEHQ